MTIKQNEFGVVFEEIMKNAYPNCIKWWERQPVDFFQEAIKDFENTLSNETSENGRKLALLFLKQELDRLVLFHSKSMEYIAFCSKEELNDLHWRVREIDPSDVEYAKCKKYGLH